MSQDGAHHRHRPTSPDSIFFLLDAVSDTFIDHCVSRWWFRGLTKISSMYSSLVATGMTVQYRLSKEQRGPYDDRAILRHGRG
jgi:hypothetical protein